MPQKKTKRGCAHNWKPIPYISDPKDLEGDVDVRMECTWCSKTRRPTKEEED